MAVDGARRCFDRGVHWFPHHSTGVTVSDAPPKKEPPPKVTPEQLAKSLLRRTRPYREPKPVKAKPGS